jgi:hypothetical protein
MPIGAMTSADAPAPHFRSAILQSQQQVWKRRLMTTATPSGSTASTYTCIGSGVTLVNNSVQDASGESSLNLGFYIKGNAEWRGQRRWPANSPDRGRTTLTGLMARSVPLPMGPRNLIARADGHATAGSR